MFGTPATGTSPGSSGVIGSGLSSLGSYLSGLFGNSGSSNTNAGTDVANSYSPAQIENAYSNITPGQTIEGGV